MSSYILRNTFSMDAKMYSKMPTEFYFGSSDCLLYSKKGKSGVRIKMIKMDNFQYFSIKSYVLDVYKNCLTEAILIQVQNI